MVPSSLSESEAPVSIDILIQDIAGTRRRDFFSEEEKQGRIEAKAREQVEGWKEYLARLQSLAGADEKRKAAQCEVERLAAEEERALAKQREGLCRASFERALRGGEREKIQKSVLDLGKAFGGTFVEYLDVLLQAASAAQKPAGDVVAEEVWRLGLAYTASLAERIRGGSRFGGGRQDVEQEVASGVTGIARHLPPNPHVAASALCNENPVLLLSFHQQALRNLFGLHGALAIAERAVGSDRSYPLRLEFVQQQLRDRTLPEEVARGALDAFHKVVDKHIGKTESFSVLSAVVGCIERGDVADDLSAILDKALVNSLLSQSVNRCLRGSSERDRDACVRDRGILESAIKAAEKYLLEYARTMTVLPSQDLSSVTVLPTAPAAIKIMT